MTERSGGMAIHSTSLLGCPICGKQPEIDTFDGGDSWVIQCEHDGSMLVFEFYGKSRQQAMEAWNTRQPND